MGSQSQTPLKRLSMQMAQWYSMCSMAQWLMMLNNFFTICILSSSSKKCLFRSSQCLISFAGLVSFQSSSRILDTSSLSAMWFADIFFPSIAGGFSLSQGKFLNLAKAQFINFTFINSAFGIKSENLLPIPRSRKFYPWSKSLIVLCFTFMSVIHLS